MAATKVEDELAVKTEQLRRLIEQTRRGASVAEFERLRDEVLRLERLVAKKNGGPYAEEWSIPHVWAGMALNCLLIAGEVDCSLIYEAKLKSGKFKVLAFRQVAGYKMSDVGDEVIGAHALAGRGLTAYGAFLIERSPWAEELQMIDKSHSQFDAERWKSLKHYMLCFKDRMFEALAIDASLIGEAESRASAATIALRAVGIG
jgi:hypothetical protein